MKEMKFLVVQGNVIHVTCMRPICPLCEEQSFFDIANLGLMAYFF